MRRLLPLVVVVAVFASMPLVGGAAPHPLATLCPSLQAEAEALSAKVGFVVLDLNDGTICAANDGDTFRTASLYKLLILVEAYEQMAAGDFSLDETITIEARHWADDPVFMRQEQPIEFEAREVLRRMIIHSENSSALALYERLTPGALAAAPSRLGLDGTSLDGPFVTTPSDIAALYAGLYRGDIVSGDASDEMLAVLRDQQIKDLIPLQLPQGIAVAHKTGIFEQSLHDAGIVFAPGGDFVLVLMTEWERDIGDSYVAIHQMVTLTYGVFAAPFEVTPPVTEPPVPVVEVAPVVAEPEPVAVTAPAALVADPQPAAIVPAAPSTPVITPAPTITWWEQPAVRIGTVATFGLAVVALLLILGATGSGNFLSSIVARFPYARGWIGDKLWRQGRVH
jgi:beta-lactamase class A